MKAIVRACIASVSLSAVGSLAAAQPVCSPGFATQVVDHWVGWDPDPAGSNPSNFLGDTDAYYSTGKGGGITISFGNPFSTTGDSGPDLCFREKGDPDCFYVCVKPYDDFTKNALHNAGIYPENGFYEVGFKCGVSDLNIDSKIPGYGEGQLLFSVLMLADDGSSGNGAELQSVESKAVCDPNGGGGGGDCFSSFATNVDDYKVGYGADSTNPNDVLGDNPNSWFNTGKNGSITVSFGQPFSTSGDSQDDLCVDEYGYEDCYYICVKPANDFTKSALVAAGLPVNSSGFYEVGFACGDKSLNLDSKIPGYTQGVLSFASVMLVDDGDATNGAEIAAVEAKFICPGGGPDCEPRFANEVISYALGSNQNPNGTDPNDALGDNNDYFSPGNGGKIELGFGAPFSTSGNSAPDLCIKEKGDNDCYYVAFKPADDFTKGALVAAGLSQSPTGFYKLGKFCGNEDIDVDAGVPGYDLTELLFDSVLITDDGNGSDGLEVQRVEAKFVCPGDAPAKIGDLVFEDQDGDGEQDAGEPGVPGVTVHLLDENSQPIGEPTTTDMNGNYEFCVDAGSYFVCFELPDGFLFSPQDAADDAVDSDADPATGCTGLITVDAGEVDHTRDAGLIPNQVAKLGDFVFEDGNANGQQNNDDAGVPGVTVRLLDASGAPAGQEMVTNDQGKYLFCVTPGTYIVEFVLPDGFEFTGADNGDDATDSDADPNTGRTGPITLASGEENLTVDAGLVAVAKIGDLVFEDKNGDGLQTAGEPGVPGVTVILLDASGNPTGQEVNTDDQGNYQFCVDPGTYVVQFVAPNGADFAPRDAGDDALDSDADPATGLTAPVTVASGDMNFTIDAGLISAATLGDRLFIDADRDGIQDDNELGLGNVKVCLIDFDTQLVVDETTTDKDGFYHFLVQPGCYQVKFKLNNPAFAFTLQDIGDDDLDSDVPSNGTTGKVVVQSGDHITNVDAGVILNNCAGTAFLGQSIPACGLPNDPIMEVTQPYIGSEWVVKVSTPGLNPNSVVWILASLGPPLNIPLPGQGCFLQVNPQALIILELSVTDENGEFTRVYKILPIPELAGVEFTVQARVCDPGNTGPIPGFPDFFSNAFHVKLGCP